MSQSSFGLLCFVSGLQTCRNKAQIAEPFMEGHDIQRNIVFFCDVRRRCDPILCREKWCLEWVYGKLARQETKHGGGLNPFPLR